MARVVTETWECLGKWLENKLVRVVAEPTEGLRKTCLENKMAKGFNRDVGVPDEEVVGKQVGAGCNPAYGGSEEDVVGKQDGAVRIGSRS